MSGKSFRRAFRKLFGLRKASSESRLNYHVSSPALPLEPASTTGSGGTFLQLRREANRSRSHGMARYSDAQIDADTHLVHPNFLAAQEMADKLEEMDTARSIRLAHQALWYWGPINAAVAETILEKEKDGTFLVRDSTDDRFLFSLSCKYDGKVGHIRIEHCNGSFMFRKIEHYKCDNIRDFIEQAVQHSQSGTMHFMTRPRPGVDATRILLLYPLSRQQTVQSLQHLARFVILESIDNRDAIARLPIPLPLKKYLNKPQYFVELDRAGPAIPGRDE